MADSHLDSGLPFIPHDVFYHHILPYISTKDDCKSLRLVRKSWSNIVKLPRGSITFQNIQDSNIWLKSVEILNEIHVRRLKSPGTLITLARAISHHPSCRVSVLDLQRLPMVKELPEILDNLKSSTSLRALSLVETRISSNSARSLADLLTQNKYIQELDLSDSSLKLRGLSEIVGALTGDNTTLRSLALNGINLLDTQAGSNCIEDLLIHNRGLTSLNLSRVTVNWNRIIASVSAGLSSNNTLSKLIMAFIKFDQSSSVLLRDALIRNTTLKTLDISCVSGWMSHAVSTILSCLEHNKSLTELFYASTGIAEEDYRINSEFFRWFRQPTCSIRSIASPIFRSTSISESNVFELRDALLVNKSLRDLKIRLPKATLVHLAPAFALNRTVVDINMECPVTQACVDALGEALLTNSTVTRLVLQLHFYSSSSLVNPEVLFRSLAHRPCLTDRLNLTITKINLGCIGAVIELLKSRNIINLNINSKDNNQEFLPALMEALKMNPQIGVVMLDAVQPSIGSGGVNDVLQAWQQASAM